VEAGQGQKHPKNKNGRKNETEKQHPFVSSPCHNSSAELNKAGFSAK